MIRRRVGMWVQLIGIRAVFRFPCPLISSQPESCDLLVLGGLVAGVLLLWLRGPEASTLTARQLQRSAPAVPTLWRGNSPP